ncbi:hypothetical protein JG688_00010303 [Phytophthora aleatoria]|uniref:Uncharacterized protein n=1 Tax=Phytophthora aleatoria TaxID=2496075 RepID=A0A8J5IW97_9STRA|nr:hypothetical protein JG688_00010303 [Phytophthora aleatoria]
MVRKTAKQIPAFVELSADEVNSIVMASTGAIKDKTVDPRKIVGTIHIKKYLADNKINGKELTAEEVDELEQCKKVTVTYLEEDASAALKAKVAESTDEMRNLKDISSSMKYKFSKFAYEAVTHVINLMESVVADSSDAVEETTDEETAEDTPEVKVSKPRLSQYISNTFKEIVVRDERFKGLLLGKEITALVNDIIFQVLDRYANVVKSLLETANSKTVNERLALIATKVLLQDHIHTSNEDVAVVLEVVQARLDQLKEQPEEETEEPSEESAK